MKHLISICFLIQVCFSGVSAQDVSMDGNLQVGGGNFTFIDDINGGSPKVIPINNSQGSLIIKTLGAPGYTFFMGRDQYVGINTESPYSDLHIKQLVTPIHSADNIMVPTGLTIESSIGEKMNMFTDNGGDLSFAFDSIQRCFIRQDNGDFVNVSDLRTKENLLSFSNNILEKVCLLKPYSYRFKRSKDSSRTLGFIAQDVQKIFPEIVVEKNGYLALSYKDFGILSVKAIQEQQTIIDQQRNEIDNLKERMSQVEKSLLTKSK